MGFVSCQEDIQDAIGEPGRRSLRQQNNSSGKWKVFHTQLQSGEFCGKHDYYQRRWSGNKC